MNMRALRLQERDRELVRTVFLHRVARRDDLLGLGFFNSVPRCNSRVSALVEAGWLRRVENINGLLGHQSVYAPGRSAASYLRQSLDLPDNEVARHCCKHEGPILVEHALRTLEFRVRLRQASQDGGPQLTEWLCEPECLHEFEIATSASGPWQTVVIKPDAFFRLQTNDECSDFFLETDLGNVSLPRFAQKLSSYKKYAECGAFEEAYGSKSFSVLTVTVGERRLSHLARLRSGGFDHILTTWQRIVGRGVFDFVCNTDAVRRVFLPAAS